MISYRRATAGDAPQIHALLVELATHDGGQIEGTPATLLHHGFGPDPLFRAVLAFDDQPSGQTLGQTFGQTLGLSLFFPEYSSWRGQAGIFIQDLYLRPAARGKGIGRGLLAASWHHAADWQPQFITLMVQQKNMNAIGFYTTLGFTPRSQSDQLILAGEGLGTLTAP